MVRWCYGQNDCDLTQPGRVMEGRVGSGRVRACPAGQVLHEIEIYKQKKIFVSYTISIQFNTKQDNGSFGNWNLSGKKLLNADSLRFTWKKNETMNVHPPIHANKGKKRKKSILIRYHALYINAGTVKRQFFYYINCTSTLFECKRQTEIYIVVSCER